MHGEPSITARSEPVWVIGMHAQNHIVDFKCRSFEIRYVVDGRAYAAAYMYENHANTTRGSIRNEDRGAPVSRS
ncbi:hypothetical protein EGT44_20270 [Burkholderia cenocepacia]|nr:hypothetical protein EGT44_20270 [Burkholderia cenocepacia]